MFLLIEQKEKIYFYKKIKSLYINNIKRIDQVEIDKNAKMLTNKE